MYRNHAARLNWLGGAAGIPAEVRLSAHFRSFSRRRDSHHTGTVTEGAIPRRKGEERLAQAMLDVPFPPDDAELRVLVRLIDAEGDNAASAAEADDRIMQSADAQFFLRIWLPCWVLHRIEPGLLLRRARVGDDDAFEALVRLDKSVIADPVLARRWHALTGCPGSPARQRFLDAMAARPRQRLDAKSVRSGLAGLISQLATGCGCVVTAPEIGRLFDAIERVRTGRLVDQALPSGEALPKAIQRNKDWPLPVPRKVDPDSK